MKINTQVAACIVYESVNARRRTRPRARLFTAHNVRAGDRSQRSHTMLSAAAAAQSSSHAAAAARPRAKRRHVERVHHNQWHAFALDSSYSHRRVRSMHARNLLSRLQHEIHAQRPSTAMQLLKEKRVLDKTIGVITMCDFAEER